MSEHQRWTPPYTVTEWIGLALAVLVAAMVGSCVYTGMSSAFGVDIDFVALAPIVIGVILYVVFIRRRRR
jgi:hypothetical protein